MSIVITGASGHLGRSTAELVLGLSAAGVPEPVARGISTSGRSICEGFIGEASGAAENLTGRPPRSLREVFEAHREELLQGVSA